MEIAGKVAIVTGGGSGIGRESVARLVQLGARVLVADVDVAGGEETVGLSPGASFMQVDVSQLDQVQAMVEEVQKRYGQLDILHNNAGILTSCRDFAKADPLRLEAVVRVNLLGVLWATQAALPALQGRGGVIINTASVGGLRPWREDPVYSATKAAVVFFTQAIARQLEGQGVRINAVCPGVVRTPLIHKIFGTDSMSEEERGKFEAYLLAHPLLEPAEVVDAVIDQIQNDDLRGEVRYVGHLPLPPEGKVMRGVV